mmetsp:Transcript_55387/g.152351  ORF Transcript_55387/g.152351 Transcript_55387/m.152351 type:complete len:203 (+) Transcript_55387:60-668(+)
MKPLFGAALWIPPLFLRWSAPPADVLRHIAQRDGDAPLSEHPRDRLVDGAEELPRYWAVNRHEAVIGSGAEAFEQASAALQELDCLQLEWLSATEEAGAMAICSRQFGFVWLVNVNRMLARRCLERSSSVSWGTTVRHVLAGEERLDVLWEPQTGDVVFRVLSFSRPRHVFSLATYPYVLMQQRRFARDAARVMRSQCGATE